jgi:hypothetical protein
MNPSIRGPPQTDMQREQIRVSSAVSSEYEGLLMNVV